MTRRLPLSTLAALIQETVEQVFMDETFWVIAEITDVKKYEQKRWCFLKFIEKQGSQIVTEMQGIFWANAYQEIIKFERGTGQTFASGIEINCRVAVRFHPRYGLKLEVQEIDASFTLGQLERERQQTLDKLLLNYPAQITLADGEYQTLNKQLRLPKVLQRIALIAAPGSDGYRDIIQELQHNQYGYHFSITTFAASVQGLNAAAEIAAQLDLIHQTANSYDVVALVRGGGSNTDFAAFDQFEVAKRIALFPLPVFTGIGHDRNTSIADLMGWQYKTPTKVASAIVDTALNFENDLMGLKEKIADQCQAVTLHYTGQLQQWQQQLLVQIPRRLRINYDKLQVIKSALQRRGTEKILHQSNALKDCNRRVVQHSNHLLQNKKQELQQLNRLIDKLSPDSILNRGFAMVMQDDKIVTRPEQLDHSKPLTTVLKQVQIVSDIKEILPNE